MQEAESLIRRQNAVKDAVSGRSEPLYDQLIRRFLLLDSLNNLRTTLGSAIILGSNVILSTILGPP